MPMGKHASVVYIRDVIFSIDIIVEKCDLTAV